jgi:hypothetical protein
MKPTRSINWRGHLILWCGLIPGLLQAADSSPAPSAAAAPKSARVFLLDPRLLAAHRQRLLSGDALLAPALAQLDRDAQNALTSVQFSVTRKTIAPPSGDPHDYMSQAPYFWRNPKTTNGLPYIRRDGERNPEINRIPDHQTMGRMVDAVETLALAYYFKGEEKYADKAARLIRAWFLSPATRMNPNLEYAQAVPGVNTGRGIGLIETACLPRLVDAVGLLAGSKSWSPADQRDLQAWFGQFLNWMLESKNGRDEAAAKNNHGTYYDIQVISFALFLDRRELASNILQTARQKRLAAQIEPDGRQPQELARTKAWSYSIMNLKGLMSLAQLGERAGIDLWHYQTPDGRSLRQAIDFLIPFSANGQKWPYQQLGEWQPQLLHSALREAALKFPGAPYQELVSKLPPLNPADRNRLDHDSRN